MIVKRTAGFRKQYSKLPIKFQEQFEIRLRIFMNNPADTRLRNHPLKGAYGGYWSININDDLRVLYKQVGDEVIIFALLGTHSQLYG